jgi:hypothetical protein
LHQEHVHRPKEFLGAECVDQVREETAIAIGRELNRPEDKYPANLRYSAVFRQPQSHIGEDLQKWSSLFSFEGNS